jgi:membrane-associated protease RseP (regulator of RpoE activity)
VKPSSPSSPETSRFRRASCLAAALLALASAPHGALAAGTLAHGTLAHGTLAHGTLAHGALAHGTLAHGTLAHGTLAHDDPLSAPAADRSCAERIRGALGAEFATLHDVRTQDREAAARLGLDERLQVVAVDAGSASHQAGLRVGDVIVSFDGQPLPGGPAARGDFLRRAERWEGPRTIAVLRGDAPLRFEVALRRACTTEV